MGVRIHPPPAEEEGAEEGSFHLVSGLPEARRQRGFGAVVLSQHAILRGHGDPSCGRLGDIRPLPAPSP